MYTAEVAEQNIVLESNWSNCFFFFNKPDLITIYLILQKDVFINMGQLGN